MRVNVVYGCPLDIGANLGYFSLIASSLHHKSIAVEAVASNVYRIREAVWRSNLSMDIYRYAIGEAQSRTSYLFQGDLSTGNRGHGQVEKIIRDYPVHPNSLPVHFRSTSGSLPAHLGTIDGHMRHHSYSLPKKMNFPKFADIHTYGRTDNGHTYEKKM